MQRIKVIEGRNAGTFENNVNELLEQGFRILSTNCGCYNTQSGSDRRFYIAIMKTDGETYSSIN